MTPPEVHELEGYEAQAQPVTAPPTGPASPAVRLTIARVREAAFASDTLAAAETRLGVKDLAGLLKKSKRLAAVWERGQLLRRIKDVASTTVVVPERADRLLGLAKGSFERLYAADRIIRELWDRERYAVLVEIERALVVRIKGGDLKAVTAVEHLFGHRTEPAGGAVDFGRLSPTQMETATGFPRQTIHRWAKENALPRQADGTYSLPDFLAWFAKWERAKITGGERGVKQDGESALERMRRVQADKLEGLLVERSDIVRMFRERAARLVQLLGEATADQWSHAHEGKTAAQLKPDYLETFRKIRTLWEEFPAEVPMPPEARAKIEEGLALLMKDD